MESGMHRHADDTGAGVSGRRVDTPLVHSIISSGRGDDVPQWVLENENNALHDVLERMQKKAARGYSGKDLIRRMEQCRCLPLGCPPIDSLLHGGILEGQVMEVFGASGTGKTQLCHMAAAMTASRGERVLYVDTNGSFSVNRVVEILRHVVGESQSGGMLDMVTVAQSVSRVDDVVSCIDSYLEKYPRPSMVIIDSFGWIIAPLIGGLSYDTGHDIMFSLIMYLKQIAAEHTCAVVVTNHTVRGGLEDGESEFKLKRSALGDTWPGHAHIRLQLVARHDGFSHETGFVNEYRAFLHQNTLGIPSHTCVTFEI
jgi:RAD51-like protein 3